MAMLRWLLAVVVLLAVAACERQPAPTASTTPHAPLLDRVGSASLSITTHSPQAQRFFNQGLRLAYAFDHAEAARAFAEAIRLDPRCAMCEWGAAHALGPNINHPERTHLEATIQHARRAIELADGASPREQALIHALATRFGLDGGRATRKSAMPGSEATPPAALCVTRAPSADTDPLDFAYARAMAQVAAQFPDDDEIAVLHAESLLLLVPWDWWSKSGEPREGTREAIEILEGVLARSPRSAGANHYLIHALEGSPTPARALAAAERLGALAPDAGHLVHMPAHIFMRLGRYADATRANQAAIEADLRLAAQERAQGFAPLAQVSHHQHFLWSSSSMEGRGEIALAAARALASVAATGGQVFGADGSNDYFLALPLFAQVRFAKWDEILAASEPAGVTTYPRAIWHWARGMAYARTGQVRRAQRELEALQTAAGDRALAGRTVKGINDLTDLLAVAVASLQGETALARRQHATALVHLQTSVQLEEALEGEEPPVWAFPTRHALGGALLLSGRAREAERVFRDDLKRHPANGWAQYGVAESLRRQGRHAEARRAQAEFRAAWAGADLARPDSRY